MLVRNASSRCCFLLSGTRSAPRTSATFAAQYPAHGSPCERFTCTLTSTGALHGAGAVGWTLLRGGLPPPILCQVCLAHAACGRLLPLKSCRISRIERPLMGKAAVEISVIEQVQPNDRYEDRPGLGGHIKKYAIMRKEVSHDEEEIPTLPSRVRASLIG